MNRLPPPAETFGHEPEWINVGYCGGCDQCGDREEQQVCARCGQLVNLNAWSGWPNREPAWSLEEVEWPCGTARILNLVDEDDELLPQFRRDH